MIIMQQVYWASLPHDTNESVQLLESMRARKKMKLKHVPADSLLLTFAVMQLARKKIKNIKTRLTFFLNALIYFELEYRVPGTVI